MEWSCIGNISMDMIKVITSARQPRVNLENPMRLGICSFSLHRTVAAGQMDFAGFVALNRRLGCTQLDPWCAHLEGGGDGANQLHAGRNPQEAELGLPPAARLPQLKAAAAGMPWGCIAVDGAHIWEDDPVKRAHNRARASAWLKLAREFGATSVRIDAGGPERPDAATWAAIVTGYKGLLAEAKGLGLELLVENHWGPSVIPENIIKLLHDVPGLGLLFDTNNWKQGLQREAWDSCARFARVVHVKAFNFRSDGEEADVDLPYAIRKVKEQATGEVSWCVESVPPKPEDEIPAIEKTLALIRKHAA